MEYGLWHFHLLVANSTVAVFSDNSTSLANLCKQESTQSPILNSIEQRILRGVGTIELVLTVSPFRARTMSWRIPCLFFPRSVDDRYGCASSELGRVSGVCLSTLVDDTTGSKEAPIISWGPHDVSCSILAPETMVSGPPGTSGGWSDLSTAVSQSPQPTTLPLSSSRDRQAVPSCLETIQRFA